MYRSHVLVCGGTGCTSSGSTKVIEALNAEIAAKGLADEIKVVQTGCFGLCALGPIMIVYPEGTFYHSVKAEDIDTTKTEYVFYENDFSDEATLADFTHLSMRQ